MTQPFEGKTAFITGGSTGIGYATAAKFARLGANVTIANTNIERGEAAAQRIRDNGGNALFVQTDVSNSAQVQNAIHRTVETFGGLNYAFNNAGVAAMGPIIETDDEVFDYVIGINLKGVWLSMKYEIQHMLQNGGGAIVNTSSTAGGKGMAGLGTYVASKHGVNGLTKALALEYAESGIRINTVMPGPIETPMMEMARQGIPGADEMFVSKTAVKRIGTPEEVANAVVWLCSDEASYITATNFPVDGGMLEL
ncbi:MAG: glucose 1-dehydrogenase [Chloroflexi bacterium]|nr:MAG: glucose 1-dehydrogenase [Chloroflexota bacterium]